MRYLNASDTRQALPMADAIKAMQHAFSGDAEIPLRTRVGRSLVMPGRLDDIMAVKVVSTVPGNPAGVVVVFGPDGTPMGLVHGPTITTIRTGAVCGLATAMLAPREVSTLAMLGAGAMAFDQVQAVKSVRRIERVLVWSRDRSNARMIADMVGGEPVADANEAVAEADVISCATPATAPLFSDSAVREVAHVNAVGAFTPEMVELPPELLKRAYVVVDDLEAAAAEAGDLIQADREPDTTLRELLADKAPEIREDVTVFKSVGVAVQDVAAAHLALSNADRLGLGMLLPG
jgi:ornithine cyclodeaminase